MRHAVNERQKDSQTDGWKKDGRTGRSRVAGAMPGRTLGGGKQMGPELKASSTLCAQHTPQS